MAGRGARRNDGRGGPGWRGGNGGGAGGTTGAAGMIGGTGPCAGICANPGEVAPNTNSGDLGTAETCDEVIGNVRNMVCGNFVAPRTLTVNGTTEFPCARRQRHVAGGAQRRLLHAGERRQLQLRLLRDVLEPRY